MCLIFRKRSRGRISDCHSRLQDVKISRIEYLFFTFTCTNKGMFPCKSRRNGFCASGLISQRLNTNEIGLLTPETVTEFEPDEGSKVKLVDNQAASSTAPKLFC